MSTLSIDEKRERVRMITSEGSALQRMIHMKRPNDAPTYDGDVMLEKSRQTVAHRGKKYARVAKAIASDKKYSK